MSLYNIFLFSFIVCAAILLYLWYTEVRHHYNGISYTKVFENGDKITYNLNTNKVHSFNDHYPAISSGDFYIWMKQGKLHGLKGAAFMHKGRCEYWIDGKQYTHDLWKKHWKRRLSLIGINL